MTHGHLVALKMPSGFLALSTRPSRPGVAELDLVRVLTALGMRDVDQVSLPHLRMAAWGPRTVVPPSNGTVALSQVLRRGGHRVPLDTLGAWVAGARPELGGMLPPFAAAHRDGEDRVTVATDCLGFRQIYVAQGDGWAGISTSSTALARCAGLGLDLDAVAVQSRLGWQLGRRTIFSGVSHLEAGHLASVHQGGLEIVPYIDLAPGAPTSMADAVARSTQLLRATMTALVEDSDGPVGLQLTGGQDSRLLLSAMTPDHRRAVTALTLAVDGSDDARIAADLAGRTGATHQVVTLESLADVSPERAHRMALAAAARLECTADPLALASLAAAEARFPQGTRVSGLGGEVARGFYYVGRVRDVPVTLERTRRLTAWRMFANERVEREALLPEFDDWAGDFAIREVHEHLTAPGTDWFRATDELYLWQRMQRWAGVTDTAVGDDREVVNPMLDLEFLNLARAVDPLDKSHSKYLGSIQMALDPALGRLPLDGRPAPEAYASPGVAARVSVSASTGRRAWGKARQRLVRGTRPAAGGKLLSEAVVAHWRANPDLLDPVRSCGVFRPAWVDEVCGGTRSPAPATVALAINVLVALGPDSSSPA